ncbi:hypothetical protein [Pontibacter arcticus]|uniref:Uncharacterized protein n=1 Tax=Pontibacter arcticus TaxID=2080288 RepID=A0A364RIG7_9BACT|nr:hypothetical protein [Pontibacter arcticus]RAU84016.1 hypothetical protein DP923_02860 [Pontibacter arcticus]
MRYPEHHSEHQQHRYAEQHNQQRSQNRPEHYNDAGSRWEEPAPFNLHQNRQMQHEGQYRREEQYQQQYNAPHYRQEHEHYNQNQGNFNRAPNYRRPDWERYQHQSNSQQAPDRWREHNWQPKVRNEHRRPYMDDQYWNEQSI